MPPTTCNMVDCVLPQEKLYGKRGKLGHVKNFSRRSPVHNCLDNNTANSSTKRTGAGSPAFSKFTQANGFMKSKSSGFNYPSRGSTPSPKMLEGAYAASKFSDPPSPNALPRPPSSWMTEGKMNTVLFENENISSQASDIHNELSCREMSHRLKVLLNMPV